MKLIQFVLASQVSGGYYQKWKTLSATEKTERQVLCDAKTEETKDLYVIDNGTWSCPNLGLPRPRVVCNPTCLPGYEPNWTEGSISKPKKDHPRFMTRCGDPANIAKRNLPSGIQLACTPIPEHPCVATAAGISITNGNLSLNTELTPNRATYNVVCDWGETMGSLYCNKDSFPYWKNPEYQEVTNACAGKCGYDPCDGLENCNVIVDACEIAPSKNNKVATLPASLNYKISADVYCPPFASWSTWKNVLHVTDGNDQGTPGSRTFALWRHPWENRFHLHSNNPSGNHYDHSDYTPFYCTAGKWHNFSVEVRQNAGTPSTLNFDVQVDGVSLKTGNYPTSGGKSSGDLQFFVSDDWYTAAPSSYTVKNFVYQTFAEI